MADQWYYQLFGQEFGPVQFGDVAQMLTTGELSGSDVVRQGESGSWVPVSKVDKLKGLVSQVAVETADEVEAGNDLLDIDSFNLVDESAPRQPQLATDIDSFMMVDEAETKSNPSVSVVQQRPAPAPARDDRPSDSQFDTDDDSPIWYYTTQGTEAGPISLNELLSLAERSKINADDLVRKGRKGRWVAADTIDQLVPVFLLSGPATIEPEPVAQPAAPQRSSSQSIPIQSYAQSAAAPAAGNSAASFARPAAAHSQPAPAPQPASTAGVAPPWLTGAPPAMELNWFCYMNNQEYGPISLEDLSSWVEQGQITREMYLKHGTHGEWVMASQVPNLFPPEPEPAPEPMMQTAAASTSNNLIDEKSELVQQLLALLKQGLSADLMGGGSIAAPAAGMGWFCNISGSVIGPVSIESLVQMVLQKRLFPDDLIRMGPTGEWFPAKSVPDLFPNSPTGGKSKKSNYDNSESVMERIDRMYREGQEAQAKMDAEQASRPSREVKQTSSQSSTNSAHEVLRHMSANIARGAPVAAKSSGGGASLSDVKLDGKTIGIIVAVLLVAGGVFYVPTLLSGFATKATFGKLVALNSKVKDAEGGSASSPNWQKQSKDMLKEIKELEATVKSGATGSAKRDVSRMARALKEMVETIGKPVPPGSPPDTPTDYQRATKAFDDYAKAAGKKLGLDTGSKKAPAKDSKKKK